MDKTFVDKEIATEMSRQANLIIEQATEIKRLNEFCLNLISEEELFQKGGYETAIQKLNKRIRYLSRQRNKIWQMVQQIHVDTKELINEVIQDND